MMALKAVVKEDPNLVMKGGTSLSKAYNILKCQFKLEKVWKLLICNMTYEYL